MTTETGRRLQRVCTMSHLPNHCRGTYLQRSAMPLPATIQFSHLDISLKQHFCAPQSHNTRQDTAYGGVAQANLEAHPYQCRRCPPGARRSLLLTPPPRHQGTDSPFCQQMHMVYFKTNFKLAWRPLDLPSNQIIYW